MRDERQYPMQSIEVELSDFSLRRRSVVVSHVAADLLRGLEPGEQLVLHDPAHGYFAGHVADLDFEPADTVYRVQIGAALTGHEALERMRGTLVAGEGPITRQDLVDLLGQLRGTRAPRPAERPSVGARRRSGTR